MSKFILKKFLQYYLKIIAKIALFIHRPIVIAIAGSTNKTFAKQEIKNNLINGGYDVRSNANNFNTEIGLPLAILNLPSGYNSYKKWLPIILKAPLSIFEKFPEYLVLELGTSDRGDIKYLLSIIKPRIAVITDITQRYLESFKDMDELVDEYRCLSAKIPKNGLLLLNNDNYRVRNIASSAKCKVIYFGFNQESDWKAEVMGKNNKGQTVKLKNNGIEEKYVINRFGIQHIYSFLIGNIIGYYANEKK